MAEYREFGSKGHPMVIILAGKKEAAQIKETLRPVAGSYHILIILTDRTKEPDADTIRQYMRQDIDTVCATPAAWYFIRKLLLEKAVHSRQVILESGSQPAGSLLLSALEKPGNTQSSERGGSKG